MRDNPAVWRSLGRGKVHPSEVLNALIELDNRRGMLGLEALEAEINEHLLRLSPRAQVLANAWLEAISAYRAAYYPRSALAKIFARIVNLEPLPKAG